MKTYFDSSAFVKRYIAEAGSEIVDEICLNTSSLALSIIGVPEILSAMNRRLRENHLTHSDYIVIKNQLLSDVEDVIILNITPIVIETAIQLVEGNVIRTLDALHVACAVEWHSELFVTSDQRQSEAAKNMGLKVSFI